MQLRRCSVMLQQVLFVIFICTDEGPATESFLNDIIPSYRSKTSLMEDKHDGL